MKIKEDIETEKNQEEQNLDDNMKLIKNLRLQRIVDINMVRICFAEHKGN